MVRYILEKDRPTQIKVRNYTGDGSTTQFTVTEDYDTAKVAVFINGVHQDPSNDYTIGGTALTISPAPSALDSIVIIEFPI
jgi:hypothetical protein